MIEQVRDIFKDRLQRDEYVIDKSGVKMIEIMNACFIADEPSIFGTPNKEYIERELEWYDSMSLNVNDIPGGPPAIWQQVASESGEITLTMVGVSGQMKTTLSTITWLPSYRTTLSRVVLP
jgi:hypothetical protein